MKNTTIKHQDLNTGSGEIHRGVFSAYPFNSQHELSASTILMCAQPSVKALKLILMTNSYDYVYTLCIHLFTKQTTKNIDKLLNNSGGLNYGPI